MDEKQRFRKRVREILGSLRCQKIAIKLDTLTITGTDYAFIGLAMLERPDTVVGMNIDLSKDQGGGSASMLPRDLAAGRPIVAFSIPPKAWYADTYHEEMIIVHEATHASIEARPGLTIRLLTNEALSYLAGAMYNRLGGAGEAFFDPVRDDRPPPHKLIPESRNVLIAADNLATITIARPNGTITQTELRPVEDTVAAHPIYANLRAHPAMTHTGQGIRLARTPAIDPSVRHVLLR